MGTEPSTRVEKEKPMPQTIQDALRKQSESIQPTNSSKPGAWLRAKGSEPRQPQAPECADCSDSGFFRFDVPVTDPRFGRLFPCPKCNAAGVAAMCGLHPHERSINVHDLGADKRPGAQAMIKAGDAFIESPTGFLSVCG